MKLQSLRHISDCLIRSLLIIMMAPLSPSCGKIIYEDLEPCEQGLRLRFVYDYNMLFANAFPSQVHCLNLFIYDRQGNFVTSRAVTDRELLSNEDWRMIVDLPGGTYQLLAYGGMECQNASFAFRPQPGPGTPMTDVDVFLKPELISYPKGHDLHDLFYGALEVTVPEVSTGYKEETVKMMKDTNNLRVILQHMDYTPVYDTDFIFEITANNTEFNYNNDIISSQTTTFSPWDQGQKNVGVGVVGSNTVDVPAEVAYAELSLSRLMENGGSRLEIKRADNGQPVLSIPLINYLLLLKSERFVKMEPQEYLDRECYWSLIFFLDNRDRWIDTQIVINDWVVRINDIIE